MTWLLVGLPLVGVIATLALLGVGAGLSFDSAPDDVRRSAQVQQRDLAADERALALGHRVTAHLRGDGAFEIALDGLPDGDYALELVHPLEARLDRRIEVARGAGVVTVADFDRTIAWRLRLAPADGHWRIVGRWDPSAPAADVVLQPAFAAAEPPR
ncbi:FixH family protein [Arenimonas composti]|uniref:FixH family protein n=1 Tax=Arenimonas composti TaxID=370776 RepID=UPI0003F7A170|nr:FixH family protein [Arenimonas composti]